MKLNTTLARIEGDASGVVSSVETKTGDKIDCQFVGITVGVEPNVDFLNDSVKPLNDSYPPLKADSITFSPCLILPKALFILNILRYA